MFRIQATYHLKYSSIIQKVPGNITPFPRSYLHTSPSHCCYSKLTEYNILRVLLIAEFWNAIQTICPDSEECVFPPLPHLHAVWLYFYIIINLHKQWYRDKRKTPSMYWMISFLLLGCVLKKSVPVLHCLKNSGKNYARIETENSIQQYLLTHKRK